jgi:hypothetical protein
MRVGGVFRKHSERALPGGLRRRWTGERRGSTRVPPETGGGRSGSPAAKASKGRDVCSFRRFPLFRLAHGSA